MEEFIPENIRFLRREEKKSTLIGPQDDPKGDDIGAGGEPIGDLIAIINNEVFNKEHCVFVLDGTQFFFRGRLYRVNEEIVYYPHMMTDKLQERDFDSLAADWKIHPVVEEVEEEVPEMMDEEEDLEDLPFDTDAVR
jgi:hypothetical protein